MIIYLILGYIISIVVSYFLWRTYLIWGKDREYLPMDLVLIWLFSPFLNIIMPVVLFIDDWSSKILSDFDYKAFFRIKNK